MIQSISFAAKVGPMDIVPILPPQIGEKLPENITKCLLDSLVLFMVSEVRTILVRFSWWFIRVLLNSVIRISVHPTVVLSTLPTSVIPTSLIPTSVIHTSVLSGIPILSFIFYPLYHSYFCPFRPFCRSYVCPSGRHWAWAVLDGKGMLPDDLPIQVLLEFS